MSIEREEDLYKPLKNHFEKNGYEIQSEVKNCDFVASKNDELVLIELKLKFCLKLVYQAMERQKISDNVYIAIPMPKGGSFKKSWHQMTSLLKSLSIGLITIKANKELNIHFHPELYQRRKNYTKKKNFLKELNERQTNINCAGTKGKIMTAYREKAILVAYTLNKNGAMKKNHMIQHLNFQKAGDILYQNHYQWFERISQGIYGLTEKGELDLKEYDFAEKIYTDWIIKKEEKN